MKGCDTGWSVGQGGAPTAVPCNGCCPCFGRKPSMLKSLQQTAVAFGGAALCLGQCGFGCQTALLGRCQAVAQAIGGFFVQGLGHGGGATHVAQPTYLDRAHHWPAANGHQVARFDLARWLGHLSVDQHTPLVQLVGRERTCFVEAGGPQPFVDAEFVHVYTVCRARLVGSASCC